TSALARSVWQDKSARRGKGKGRNPKSEIRKKAAIRRPKTERGCSRSAWPTEDVGSSELDSPMMAPAVGSLVAKSRSKSDGKKAIKIRIRITIKARSQRLNGTLSKGRGRRRP